MEWRQVKEQKVPIMKTSIYGHHILQISFDVYIFYLQVDDLFIISTNNPIPHYYLVSTILKANNITIIHNDIFPNSSSKDLLQGHSAYNSCNWKPPFRCRSERVKLDVPDYYQLGIILRVSPLRKR